MMDHVVDVWYMSAAASCLPVCLSASQPCPTTHLVLQALVLPNGPAPVLPGPLEVRQHRHGAAGQLCVRESWAQIVRRRLLEGVIPPHQLAGLRRERGGWINE